MGVKINRSSMEIVFRLDYLAKCLNFIPKITDQVRESAKGR